MWGLEAELTVLPDYATLASLGQVARLSADKPPVSQTTLKTVDAGLLPWHAGMDQHLPRPGEAASDGEG